MATEQELVEYINRLTAELDQVKEDREKLRREVHQLHMANLNRQIETLRRYTTNQVSAS